MTKVKTLEELKEERQALSLVIQEQEKAARLKVVAKLQGKFFKQENQEHLMVFRILDVEEDGQSLTRDYMYVNASQGYERNKVEIRYEKSMDTNQWFDPRMILQNNFVEITKDEYNELVATMLLRQQAKLSS